MSSLKNLVGRKFIFKRDKNTDTLTPVVELPSATWFHPDRTGQDGELVLPYSKHDAKITLKFLEDFFKD